ncbi:hypothetical protein [Mucilaginibacter sp. UYCu711]
MQLFIANIPHQIDEVELSQLLHQFGSVVSLNRLMGKENGSVRVMDLLR